MRVQNTVAPVIWLTGLSGSGKTTIAHQVCRELEERGLDVEYLDGDVIRSVFPNTGFGRADRDAHIRRIGFLASRLARHGVAVVVALVSPYRDSRAFARGLCRNFIEVHVSTPLDICEARDVKGLYAKARRGEIRQFTGIDDPYEPPVDAELVIDTSDVPLEDAVRMIMCSVDNPASRLREPAAAAHASLTT